MSKSGSCLKRSPLDICSTSFLKNFQSGSFKLIISLFLELANWLSSIYFVSVSLNVPRESVKSPNISVFDFVLKTS